MLRYAITSRLHLGPDEPSRQSALLALASTWASTGIDYIQLREKDLPASALVAFARRLLAALRTHTPPGRPTPQLLINSRADVALAVRAPGVHLTSGHGALIPFQVRALYARARLPAPIVSLSCHTLDEIARAAGSGSACAPTLILFGPVFGKTVSPDPHPAPDPASPGKLTLPATGLDLLRSACLAAAPIPVLALGGVTHANTPACLSAGAAGIAAIRLFSPALTLRP